MSIPSDDHIQHAAQLLADARFAVALTGAGISVESGIPPFRGKGGLWEKIDPIKVAHIDAFLADPAYVWQALFKMMKEVLDRARPNEAHTALARLERMGRVKGVITQNVDGLHQMAGSGQVIEFHGSFAQQRCMDCDTRMESSQLDLSRIPPKCACGGLLRPDVVFFGELIPATALEQSRQWAAACDLMLVIGTSATVEPAAYMPVMAKHSGARIIEINPEPTPLTGHVADLTLLGSAGQVMAKIVTQVAQIQA